MNGSSVLERELKRESRESSPPRGGIDREVRRGTGVLEPLAGEWRELWLACGAAPFQAPEWLIPWAKAFGAEPRVLAWRAEGRLVGLAPFWIHREPEGDRKLLLMGCGSSDYLDILVLENFKAAVLDGIRDWLNETQKEWDRCNLTQLPPESALLELAPADHRQPGEACPVLSLEGAGLEDYAPTRQLEKLRYYRRRSAKQGAVEMIRGTEATAAGLMERLFELHAARWRERGEDGVLGQEAVRAFHFEEASRMASAGMLRLYGMRLNGELIAVLYGFASPRRTYYYLSGFDPKHEKLSPGTMLVGYAIEQALAEGHEAFEFLRGREAYKYAWGARDAAAFSLSIGSPPRC